MANSQTPSDRARPAAARLQGIHNEGDTFLRNVAVSDGRPVAFWWGVRRDAQSNLARCYICQQVMARWSGRYPITAAARRAILGHRYAHLTGEAPVL